MSLDKEGSNIIDGQGLKMMLIAAHKYLEKHKEKINDLNVYPVPDGDTGTNMGLTMQAAVEGIFHNNSDNIGKIADLAADSALLGARGNSGVILSQLFRGCARGLRGKKKAAPLDVAKAFQYGVVYAYRSVSKPVEGTILTVAREMAKGAKKALRANLDLRSILDSAVESGTRALKKTQEQLPSLKEAGVVDAGGQGLLIIIKSFQAVLNGELDIDGVEFVKEEIDINIIADNGEEKSLTFPFCTELIIKGANIRTASLRRDLQSMGDSLIVAGDDNLAKVHIHTNHPGEVLELCLKRGTIHDIKIDNMLDQHRKKHFPDEKTDDINLIAVCNGVGIEDLFKDLKVAKIISGGPTMNPQVKDFVQAIRELQGTCIILPNDKNIRLAAEQAAQLVNKEVYVLPVNNIPQGLAAAMAFKKGTTIEQNLENMQQHLEDIKSGEVTYAVREGTYHNFDFKKGDILGIQDGIINEVGEDPEKVAENLVFKMVDEESEIITILYGDSVSEEKASELKSQLEEKFPEQEIEFIRGGQPLYYYLISVE